MKCVEYFEPIFGLYALIEYTHWLHMSVTRPCSLSAVCSESNCQFKGSVFVLPKNEDNEIRCYYMVNLMINSPESIDWAGIKH